MRSLRVLHVIPSVSETRGGPSHVLKTQARSLARLGCEVTVITTDDDGAKRLDIPLDEPVQEDEVTYRYFPRQTRFYTVSLPLRRWLRKNVEQFDVSHIHALFSFPSVAGARAATLRRVPFVLRPLGTLENWGLANRRPLLKRTSLAFIEKRILEDAAFVQFTSEKEAVEAKTLNIRFRSIVIPNPVELPETSEEGGLTDPRAKTDERTVLFLSRIDPKKGIEVLLQAMAHLIGDGTNVRLVVAGGGEASYEASLRQLASRLSIDDRVTWTGQVGDRKKAELLATSDVFVLPSLSENFGVSVVEAMHAGLPVVISDNVGIKDVIEEAGAGLVFRLNPEELGRALRTVLEDTELRERFADLGKDLARTRFAPDTVAAQLIDMYQTAITDSAKNRSQQS